MAWLLVWCKLNRHAHWLGANWTVVPADPVLRYPTFLLVGRKCNIQYYWCDVTNTHYCWPRVSLTVMCVGSVPHNKTHVNVRMYDELVAIHCCCLRNWYHAIRHDSWSMKKATWPMPLHQSCQLTMFNFIRQACFIVNTTYMSAGPVPLPEESYYVTAAATYMPAGHV